MDDKILEVLKNVNEDILEYAGTNMLEDDVIDSFELINIVSDLEEAFDIEIEADLVIAENFATVETISELIKSVIG